MHFTGKTETRQSAPDAPGRQTSSAKRPRLHPKVRPYSWTARLRPLTCPKMLGFDGRWTSIRLCRDRNMDALCDLPSGFRSTSGRRFGASP